jgi:protoheme IX farnesyltransferase
MDRVHASTGTISAAPGDREGTGNPPRAAGNTSDPGRPATAGATGRRPAREVGRALLALTKPRIIELLLVTTVPAMMLARQGLPDPGLLLVTLAGGALAAGSANTFNCYLDRDIDAVMRRTSRRPLARPAPLAVIRPLEALAFGAVLAAAATVMLGLLVNWLAAALADAAIVFYVVVYTLTLKRRTPSSIVIGGAAGCFPVLVGWAAATGTVGLAPVILFAIVFFWTPPHFWALAMRFRDDYVAAAVPMLPVVAPAPVVATKILRYSYAMVAVSLALIPYAGWVYAAGAAGLGGWFLAEAHRLRSRVASLTADASAVTPAGPQRPAVPAVAAGVTEGSCAGLARPSPSPAPMRLFHLSIGYLTLLSVLIALTSLIPWGHW